MKQACALLVACLIIGASCSNSRSHDVVKEIAIEHSIDSGNFVSDDESVWYVEEAGKSSRNHNAPVFLNRVDASSGEEIWSEQIGFFSLGGLVLHEGFLWFQVASLEPQNVPGKSFWLQVDAESGELLTQLEIEGGLTSSTIAGTTLWSSDLNGLSISVIDTESADVVETLDFLPFDFSTERPKDSVVVDDVVWVLGGSFINGYNAETREFVKQLETTGLALIHLDTWDGFLWAGNWTPNPRFGEPEDDGRAYRIDTETGEVAEFGFFESPIGSIEFDGYEFDLVGADKIEQIDIETGDKVASYEGINPLTMVITDGYLWGHNEKEIRRYKTITRTD